MSPRAILEPPLGLLASVATSPFATPLNQLSQARPRLITFATSHYCEKARWALDWHGIAYSETVWLPGLHHVLAKRSGAKRTSLPILLDGGNVIEGSSTIIDWAESKATDRERSLAPTANLAEAKAIERRADSTIGVHVRRLAYAQMLTSHSHLVKAALFQKASGWHRLVGGMMWPVVRRLMLRIYDVGPGAASESRSKFEAELDWLDGVLADGRTYLAGDRFSRADLTVASLLGAYSRPKETPVYDGMAVPEVLADICRWSERPTMRWVIAQYSAHRRPIAG